MAVYELNAVTQDQVDDLLEYLQQIDKLKELIICQFFLIR